MKIVLLLAAIFLGSIIRIYAQQVIPSFPNEQTAEIKVVLDSVAKGNLRYKQSKGYRILLYSGNKKTDAVKTKEFIYRINPEIDIIYQYLSPNFKVKVGNFITKTEAIQYLKELKEFFPDAILLPDMVNIR